MRAKSCVFCVASAAIGTATAEAQFQQPEQGSCPSGHLQLVDGDWRSEEKNWACCEPCPGGTHKCYNECSCMCYEEPSASDVLVVIGSSEDSIEKCVTASREGLVCDADAGSESKRVRTRRRWGTSSGGHTFNISTREPNQVCARRLDEGAEGWAMVRLVIKCYQPVCSHAKLAEDRRCSDAALLRRVPGPEGKTFDECREACCSEPTCRFFGSWHGHEQVGEEAVNDCRLYSSCEQEGLQTGYHNGLYSVEWIRAEQEDEEEAREDSIPMIVAGIFGICGVLGLCGVLLARRYGYCGGNATWRLLKGGTRVAAQQAPVAAVAPSQPPPGLPPPAVPVEDTVDESVPVAIAVPVHPAEAAQRDAPVCPNCESPMEAEEKFCRRCGAASRQEVLPTEPDI